jgi:CheY-like chemotaxis protein
MSTILVIEPNTLDREHALAILEEEGHSVVACSTLRQGLDLLSVRKFDLVLTDLVCPPYSYLDIGLRDLQPLQRAARGIPLVLHTRWLGLSTERARREGYFELVRKPFEPDELMAKVAAGLAARAPSISGWDTGWSDSRGTAENRLDYAEGQPQLDRVAESSGVA